MRAAVAITFTMYLVAMFGSSKSLKCYVCNLEGKTIRDPDCETIDPIKSTHLNECPDLGVKCGIIVTFGRNDEVESASRGCMQVDEAERCENLQHPYISCQTCETDGCNNVNASDITQYKEENVHDEEDSDEDNFSEENFGVQSTHDPSEL